MSSFAMLSTMPIASSSSINLAFIPTFSGMLPSSLSNRVGEFHRGLRYRGRSTESDSHTLLELNTLVADSPARCMEVSVRSMPFSLE